MTPRALLKALWLPASLLVITLLAALAALHVAQHAQDRARDQLRRTQAQHASHARAAAQHTADAAERTQLHTRLDALQASGLLTPPQRLDWIEALRQIRQQRRLAKLDYEIAPQRAADPALTGPAPADWAFYATPMKLQLAALHEDDLLTLLDDLKATTRPHLHLTACSLSRATNPPPARGPTPTLSADCQLEWIHAQAKTAAP